MTCAWSISSFSLVILVTKSTLNASAMISSSVSTFPSIFILHSVFWKGGWMGEDKTQFLDWLADQISNNLMMKRGLKWWSFQSKIYSKIFKNYFPKIKRLESNIELKSSNISFFKIIHILNKFKIFEDHRIRKFRNFINLKKTRLFKWEKNKWMLLLCKQRRHAELIQLIYKAGAFTYFLLT